MSNTELTSTYDQKLYGFMELINNKLDVILQQNQFIYQEINIIKAQQLNQDSDYPRKRVCTNNREKINTIVEPDDHDELKRKTPKQNSKIHTRPIVINNESDESSKESDDDDSEDEKERVKWLEMQELKHRITEIETKTRNIELDQYHTSESPGYIS
jgi:hypothetical protein